MTSQLESLVEYWKNRALDHEQMIGRMSEATAELEAELEIAKLALANDEPELRDALEAAEAERDDYATRLHTLRWLLGLDTHKDEKPQPVEVSVKNLRRLLAGSRGGVYTQSADALEADIDRRVNLRLRERLEAAEAERNEWKRRASERRIAYREVVAKMQDAEAENARLREALREIERLAESPSWDDPSAGVGPIARAALAGSDDD